MSKLQTYQLNSAQFKATHTHTYTHTCGFWMISKVPKRPWSQCCWRSVRAIGMDIACPWILKPKPTRSGTILENGQIGFRWRIDLQKRLVARLFVTWTWESHRNSTESTSLDDRGTIFAHPVWCLEHRNLSRWDVLLGVAWVHGPNGVHLHWKSILLQGHTLITICVTKGLEFFQKHPILAIFIIFLNLLRD